MEVIIYITSQVIESITYGFYFGQEIKEDLMNLRLITLVTLFVGFLVLTVVAAYHHSYIGIFEAGFKDSASMQVFFDLVISVSLFGFWMLFDARKRGAMVLPYLVAIPFIGSLSPLLYLIVREAHGNQERTVGTRYLEPIDGVVS